MNDGLRRTPFHRVLHRPNLFLGGERELVMITAFLCGGIAFSSQTWLATIICFGIWFLTIGLFRLMAKHDPYLTRVYWRHIRYQAYYSARSRPSRQG